MYRIFDLVSRSQKEHLVPCELNYKTDTTISMLRSTKLDKGRLVEVLYSDFDNNSVLKVTIDYSDNTGDPEYPLQRVTTREWFTVDGQNQGILNFDKSIKLKKYDKYQTIEEGITRRTKLIDNFFATANSLGYHKEASEMMREKSAMIGSYKLVGDTTLIDYVNDSTVKWLGDAYPNVTEVTIRQVIVSGLTI